MYRSKPKDRTRVTDISKDSMIKHSEIKRIARGITVLMLAAFALLMSGCSRAMNSGADSGAHNGADNGVDSGAYNEDLPKGIPEDKRLIVYTSHKKEVFEPVISEFEDRTGIWVELQTGGTMELMERISSQAEGGHDKGKAADIMFGGGVESYEAFKSCFEPYSCKESDFINPKFRDREDIWTAFTELPIVFIYNKKLVSEENAPKQWSDFYNTKWIGKIAFADPLNSGSSCTALETLAKVTGDKLAIEKFYNQLAGRISHGSGYVIDEVDKGRALIGITLEETALKAVARGRDIGIIYPEDGTSALPDGCAIIRNAAHKENAELFIDFIVSRDIQRLASEKLYRRSVRTDIVEESKKNIKIVELDIDKAVSEQKNVIENWKQLQNKEGAAENAG